LKKLPIVFCLVFAIKGAVFAITQALPLGNEVMS